MTARSFATPTATPDPGPRQGTLTRGWRGVERALDRVCGEADNPLRQLGALGYLMFWLVAATGIYLYIFFETSVDGAHASVERLTHDQWWAGGVLRSLHRYASDAMVVLVALHLLRELALGRFSGFRWFSWVSGVPTPWLLVASGVTGYWLVWDEVAQFVGIAVTEWFGALPGFGPALVRNFVGVDAMTDRMFSLLAFLHIGLPLALLLAMWAHIQRLTRPRTTSSRALTLWSVAALLLVSLVFPAQSQPPADLLRVPATVPIDWFYLGIFPAMYESSPGAVWVALGGTTLLLVAMPWAVRRERPAPVVVDPANCNGCTRCFADCPYEAIEMLPHPSGRGQIASVDEDRCASCGICAGACPSSTPFRSGQRLATGIDLPAFPIDALRVGLDAGIESARAVEAGAPVVLFACAAGATVPKTPGVLRVDLVCAGMLPPAFVDYALRAGAAGVVVSSCPPEDCEFRFGARWLSERLAGEREPGLREAVDRSRIRFVRFAREQPGELAAQVERFRIELATRPRAPAPRAERTARRESESTGR